MTSLFGLTVRSSPFALETRCRVEAWPGRRKRRRRWHVVRRTQPGIYFLPQMNTLVVHPELLPRIIQVASTMTPRPAPGSPFGVIRNV